MLSVLCFVSGHATSTRTIWARHSTTQFATLAKQLLSLGLTFHSRSQRDTSVQVRPVEELQPVPQGTEDWWLRHEGKWIKMTDCNMVLLFCFFDILKKIENILILEPTNSYVKAEEYILKKEEKANCQFSHAVPPEGHGRGGEDSFHHTDKR